MNKTAIKNYAVWARNELIERVTRKAFDYGIEENHILDENLDNINGKLLTVDEKKQRKELIKEIKDKGFEHVIEEVAYTWFNRFIALRFMEANNYLPNRVRIFTDLNNEFNPQILDEAMSIDLNGLDKELVFNLIESNNRNELYKQLLLATCNDMGNYLPGMFTKISDFNVLLFPDNLLNKESVLGRLISDIDEDSWIDSEMDNESSNGITIIGWMYQYYISEKHNQVINIMKGTVKKDDIPAATQLWTTDWVVRYMVDNSLGRYWVERNPNSSLKDKLIYLATSKNGELPIIDEKINPEEITFLDPCMGSGHILAYAFDVLMEIYKECGYSERDAALKIVEKNLYGLDIDDRAYQLSYFAVMMKARSYNRRALTSNIKNNLASIQESNTIDSFAYEGITNDKEMIQIGEYLVNIFKDAKELGSLITVKKDNYDEFGEYLNSINNQNSDLFAFEWKEYTLKLVQQLNKQANILSKKYTICTTNPPYLNRTEGILKQFINKHYKNYSIDLFSVFMIRNLNFCIENGYIGFMTPNVWMYNKSFEKTRDYIISKINIITLIQMAKGAFFKEATVDICAFVLSNKKSDTNGIYIRLEDFKANMEIQKEKAIHALKNPECKYLYERNISDFSKISGSPIAFYGSKNLFDLFDLPKLSDLYPIKVGLQTGNNDKFLRLWFEIECDNKNWVPHTKGGSYRKWYGNYEYLIFWKDNGNAIKNNKGAVIRGEKYYFRNGVSWSHTTSAGFSGRLLPKDFIINVESPTLFEDIDYEYLLAFLNSKIVKRILELIDASVHYTVGTISKIPFNSNILKNEKIKFISKKCIELSKKDWDSFETSWDFIEHPFIKWSKSLCDSTKIDTYMSEFYGDEKFSSVSCPLELCYLLWQGECNERFNQLKANEEEINEILIDIYGLQNELTPEVDDKDVTVRKADLSRDIKSFISYAVGCMFGRYSLDVEGIAYAGGEFDSNKYISFLPDYDNIIPICDDEYFNDDIVGRFINFVEVVFGKDSLEDNLTFIANSLSGKGTSREVIRNYFLNDFYKFHCNTYQVIGSGKRPIYWLFDSGKKNGFKALVYLHRYQPDLIARMRTQYVFEQQSRYKNLIDMIEKQSDNVNTSSERVRLTKQLKGLKEQDEELRKYEEIVHHYADQMISLDLDDGVKVNYDKFKDLLAKIK